MADRLKELAKLAILYYLNKDEYLKRWRKLPYKERTALNAVVRKLGFVDLGGIRCGFCKATMPNYNTLARHIRNEHFHRVEDEIAKELYRLTEIEKKYGKEFENKTVRKCDGSVEFKINPPVEWDRIVTINGEVLIGIKRTENTLSFIVIDLKMKCVVAALWLEYRNGELIVFHPDTGAVVYKEQVKVNPIVFIDRRFIESYTTTAIRSGVETADKMIRELLSLYLLISFAEYLNIKIDDLCRRIIEKNVGNSEKMTASRYENLLSWLRSRSSE